MSDAQTLLEQARRATDARQADRLATQAIGADPDLGPAYGLRAALAARRGDPIVAAHYFRVAYARGDRSEITRAGLSACLAAVGESGVSARVAAGARLPAALADFGEGLSGHAGPLRAVLSARMPPAGQPALLPGEKGSARREPRAEPQRPPARPTDRASLPRVAPPAPRPSQPAGPPPKVIRRSTHVQPSWLEPTRFDGELGDSGGARPDWLEDNSTSPRASGAFTGGGIELTADPGVPTVKVRSPITGLLIDEQVIARERQGAVMPELGGPEDPLEAREALLDLLPDPDALRLAVHLPGPVVTAPGGGSPRKLAERVALGLIADEILLRDGSNPPARVPIRAIERMEIVDDGAQLSLHLQDRRQMHLDLRALKRRAPFVASRLADAIADRL